MEWSPIASPLHVEEGFSSGSPSARTPLVEVMMPMPSNSQTFKRRVSTTDSTRIDRGKRARCVVSSPAVRIINQIHVSTPTTSRSPRSSTARNPHGSRTKDTSRQLRSIYWKEFDPIIASAYPVLARMACDVLSTPASTVPSESAFSTGERVVSDFRSRLSTDTVEALIFLQDWMRAASKQSLEKLVLQVVAQPVYKTSKTADLESHHVEDHTEDLVDLASWP